MSVVAVISSHEVPGIVLESFVRNGANKIILTYKPNGGVSGTSIQISPEMRRLVESATAHNCEQVAQALYSLLTRMGISSENVHHYCDDIQEGLLQQALIKQRESLIK